MKVTIRPMQPSDVPELVRGWNRSIPHEHGTPDGTYEEWFKEMILCAHGIALVAVSDGRLAGFVSAIAYDIMQWTDNGCVTGLFVLEEFRRQGIGTKLLDEATRYIQSEGNKGVRMMTNTGGSLIPGIDVRYKAAVRFLESKGFQRKDDVITDVNLELKEFQISDCHKDARRRMALLGVHIEEYDPLMLPEMQKFVEKSDVQWMFGEGWEERGFKQKGCKFVALRDKEIVGWVEYIIGSRKVGCINYIGVLREMRRNGIGSCLLLEAVLSMKAAGADSAYAAWAGAPFYLANGWKIARQYAVLEKRFE